MLRQSVIRLAVGLNIDSLANSVLERFSRRFQILTYHKVSPDPHPFFAPTYPAVFEQQMQFLATFYRVMPLAELVERSQRGDIPPRSVAVTFDDGYRDNYDFAFPILKKWRIPATIFVATGVIETGETLWHDRIFDAFRFATAEQARREPPAQRQRRLESALDRARRLYGEERRQWLDEVEEQLKPLSPENQASRMLNWSQIREMQSCGVDFGSHTVTHPILSRIPSREMLTEIRESKQLLEERLRIPITSFAYPNGKANDYNQDVQTALRESGYSCAVTARVGINAALGDPFELRRGQPWQEDIDTFRLSFFLQRRGLLN
jgi:peptidoglycan/xylan/chitin deacetylase (PgdA/CDA1 family)